MVATVIIIMMVAVISWLMPGAPLKLGLRSPGWGGLAAGPALFPLHQSERWVAARWQWKPAAVPPGLLERAPPCLGIRGATPRHPG